MILCKPQKERKIGGVNSRSEINASAIAKVANEVGRKNFHQFLLRSRAITFQTIIFFFFPVDANFEGKKEIFLFFGLNCVLCRRWAEKNAQCSLRQKKRVECREWSASIGLAFILPVFSSRNVSVQFATRGGIQHTLFCVKKYGYQPGVIQVDCMARNSVSRQIEREEEIRVCFPYMP